MRGGNIWEYGGKGQIVTILNMTDYNGRWE